MSNKTNNIIDEVVKKNLCCGCGICAGIAEKCDLKMHFNKYGELIPVVTDCVSCGYCLYVCPVYNKSNNRKKSLSPLGKYIDCFVGYSTVGDERARGSSGGLATRISKVFLEKRLVDGVIVVGKSNKSNRLFEPIIAKTAQEVDACAGSKYYPVEFSSVLKILKKENERYAFIGLPCVIDGLRLVQQKYPEIGEKIKYLFGLTCGDNKNKYYTSFLLDLEGVKEKDVETVIFRSKDDTGKAINYGFKSILKDGRIGRQLRFQDTLVKDVWCKRYFSLGACFYCHDLFAEQADISFMDAWLKPYIYNPLGTSIIVVRNEKLMQIVKEEKSIDNIKITEISEKEILRSQKETLVFKKSNSSVKRKFLFNMHLSNKCYRGDLPFRSIGTIILKAHLLLKRTDNLL